MLESETIYQAGLTNAAVAMGRDLPPTVFRCRWSASPGLKPTW